MAVAESIKDPGEKSRWARMRSRLGAKKHKKQDKQEEKGITPVISKTDRPPLRSVGLPFVLDQHEGNLSFQGWTTVTFPREIPHPLQVTHLKLFEASKAFFDLSLEEKKKYKSHLGTEEGWSRIDGEKEYITLRTLEKTPDVLKEPAQKFWDAAGTYMDSVLQRINLSLLMPAQTTEDGLRRFGGPCVKLPEKADQRNATMLRLFRYEGDEEKVVAEPHADLGLLSMVIGDTPGLEVWDVPTQDWFDIESEYTRPCATLLTGRQLQRLTNYRYPAGGHRVYSYGDRHGPKYRYSIVFVFRAHEPVVIDTDELTTEITGPFKDPVKGRTAGQLYEDIRKAHYNINIDVKTRAEQKRKLDEKKKEDARRAAERRSEP